MLGRLTVPALLLLLAGCTAAPEAPPAPRAAPPAAPASATPTAAPSPAPSPAAPAPPPAPALPIPTEPYTFVTSIADGRYAHPRLDAQPQATIRWQNLDGVVHSVVSSDGGFPGSGPIAPGSEFAFTFPRTGDFAYHCRYHAGMSGVVVVR